MATRIHTADEARPRVRLLDVKSVSDVTRLDRNQLLRLARDVPFYHTLELPDGTVIEGRYDHRPTLPAYRFPALDGAKVLDVGRASGFFSFHFERAGARHVTATDLPPGRAKNVPGLPASTSAPDSTHELDRLDFWIGHALMGSKVRPVWCDVSDISAQSVGDGFDMAFVGSLLVHLADPIGCLARVRRVMVPGGICVVANPIGRFDHLLYRVLSTPRARLTTVDRQTSWWVPNIPCLMEMMRRAGFDDVSLQSSNLLLSRSRRKGAVRHAVVHGRA
jgi:SAM-dependent methyltransferase